MSLYCAIVTIVVLRRRLPVVMVKLRMSQTLADAIKFVEQGREWWSCHGIISVTPPLSLDVRVGPDVVCDPAYLVTR